MIIESANEAPLRAASAPRQRPGAAVLATSPLLSTPLAASSSFGPGLAGAGHGKVRDVYNLVLVSRVQPHEMSNAECKARTRVHTHVYLAGV